MKLLTIAGFVGATIGVLYEVLDDSSILWLLASLAALPGLFPLVFVPQDARHKWVVVALPLINGFAYWIIALGARRILKAGKSERILVSAGALLVVLAAFLLVQWRRNLDDALDVSLSAESRVFRWGRGEITLPPGFTHERLSGMDTLVGRLTSTGGEAAIEYDIGELASEHGGVGATETTVDGSRVRYGRAQANGEYFAKVTFPDNGCANFFISSPQECDLNLLDSIARSFHPKNRTPAWLLRCLPDILRLECRYR